ncbi:MAG: DUF1127 domain-containing protein [Pseudomonadota bacterium]
MNKYALALSGTGFKLPVISVFNLLGVMAERRQLEQLTDHELADIGLDRKAALREARRPFWDLPKR